jgi:hypothetical protein
VRHELARLVLDCKEKVDKVDLELEAGNGLVVFGLGRGVTHGRGVRRWRELSPGTHRSERQEQNNRSETTDTHVTPLDAACRSEESIVQRQRDKRQRR